MTVDFYLIRKVHSFLDNKIFEFLLVLGVDLLAAGLVDLIFLDLEVLPGHFRDLVGSLLRLLINSIDHFMLA